MSKCCGICKICNCPVKEGTGIQCQGACCSWLHFKCLNYSPCKIAEIKCGKIKVLCPCPGCNKPQAKICGVPVSSSPRCPSKSAMRNPCSPPVKCASGTVCARPKTCVSKCPSLATVETMCKKLERLTCQITHILCKMKDQVGEDSKGKCSKDSGCCSCSIKCNKKRSRKKC